MTKEERELLEDFIGYIQFELDNDHGDGRIGRVFATLGHDIGGVSNGEECFLPRTDGYRKYKREA